MKNYRVIIAEIRQKSIDEDNEQLYKSFVEDVLSFMDRNIEEYVEKYPFVKNMLVSIDKKYIPFHHSFSRRMNDEKHMDLQLTTTVDLLWVDLV